MNGLVLMGSACQDEPVGAQAQRTNDRCSMKGLLSMPEGALLHSGDWTRADPGIFNYTDAPHGSSRTSPPPGKYVLELLRSEVASEASLVQKRLREQINKRRLRAHYIIRSHHRLAAGG